MHSKIFRSSLLVSMLSLVAAIALILGFLFSYFENQLEKELENEAIYISNAIEHEGIDYLSDIQNNDKRITLISADGTVLADTSVDAEKLENHLNREEVKQAFETGKGSSVRYSDTITEKVIYYAEKMNDGTILRISSKQYTVWVVLLGIAQPIAIILIISIVLSLVLSMRVSKSIVEPINSLNLENPADNECYEEIAPLLKKISTQHRTIQNQLIDARKRQEEFRLITENMTEGLLIIDKNMNLLSCNSSAQRILHIPDNFESNVLVVNRSKNFRQTLDNAIDGNHAESELNADDRHYSIIANPVCEEQYVIGAVIVIIDITEQKMREQMRQEFTSNVSHELKTPLTSISGFAEMMMNGDTEESIVKDFSKSIYDEAQRLISLVMDIIQISELDEGSKSLEKEYVDLYELSCNIKERLTPQTKKKNVQINIHGGSVKVTGVKKILDEMIFNLCDNAVKYNKENGTIDIITASSSEEISVTVRDTGIGIPESSLCF